jgi:NAD(P)-dependent dehydrogenase (short-subunit alcohol dehydrogenase family)
MSQVENSRLSFPIHTGTGRRTQRRVRNRAGLEAAWDASANPDDVARAIAGLLSDDNRWVNAQSIEIAGGFMI